MYLQNLCVRYTEYLPFLEIISVLYCGCSQYRQYVPYYYSKLHSGSKYEVDRLVAFDLLTVQITPSTG